MADLPPASLSTTDRLVALAATPPAAISDAMRRTAAFSIFDTMAVARAGAKEPVARIVRQLALGEAGRAVASIAGARQRVPARAAALVNGTTAHALDYDDTHFGHVGHVSVAVLPAALSVGEEMEASGEEVAHAFSLGAEAACRVGRALGRAHYVEGFHQTATSGAFGACVAAGILYRLGADEMRAALGLVSTMAAGLRTQFGTMGKPLNAGFAAQNGVTAAALARAGATSTGEGFDGPGGYCAAHAGEGEAALADPPVGAFLFEANAYKLHACCHGTHAMIEAIAALKGSAIAPGAVERITLRTNPRWLTVCDIKRPRTGLELKFSYAFLAAMALSGISTAAESAFTDEACADADLAALAARVTVSGDPEVGDTEAVVALRVDGAEVVGAHDLAAPVAPQVLEARLKSKAAGLLGTHEAERLFAAAMAPGRHSARDLGALLAS